MNINKHTTLSVFLLLLCVSTVAAAKNPLDETGKSADDMLEWVVDLLSDVFWYVVPIGLLVGVICIAVGGSALSANGQKKVIDVMKAVAALYLCLWIVSSIKSL